MYQGSMLKRPIFLQRLASPERHIPPCLPPIEEDVTNQPPGNWGEGSGRRFLTSRPIKRLTKRAPPPFFSLLLPSCSNPDQSLRHRKRQHLIGPLRVFRETKKKDHPTNASGSNSPMCQSSRMIGP